MKTFSPPTTRSKGKAKIGKGVWDGPAIALRQAHNVVTDDKLKGLSSIPSHELVSYHIHKLVQVFHSMFLHHWLSSYVRSKLLTLSSLQVISESLHLMTDYLSSEEKVVVANSKVDSVKVESSRLRKDLIEALDQSIKAKEKVKEPKEALKVEKKHVIHKDEEVQADLLRTNKEREKVIARFLESRFFDLQFEQYFKSFKLFHCWMIKHHGHVANFVNLDFEVVDTEILVDEANEKKGESIAKTTKVIEEEGTVTGGVIDEAQIEEDHVEEIVNAP